MLLMKSKFHNLLIGPLKTRKKLFFFLVFHCSSFISLTSKYGWLEILNFLILEVSGSPDYYTPKWNKDYTRYQFLHMRMTASQTTAAYATRLREKANECDFGDSLEDRILEHFIQTTDNQALTQKCISKGWP